MTNIRPAIASILWPSHIAPMVRIRQEPQGWKHSKSMQDLFK